MGRQSCPTCGEALDASDRFCGSCGASVGVEPGAPAGPRVGPPAQVSAPVPPVVAASGTKPTAPPVVPPSARPVEAAMGDTDAAPSRRLAGEIAPVPGSRPRDVGLALIRVALGLLLVYPRNPLFHGHTGALPGDPAYTWSDVVPVEFWARTAVPLDLDFFYAMAVTQLVAGGLIVAGVLFRTACLVMALTWVVVLGYVFFEGSALEMQLNYALTAMAFVGLALAGPGRWVVGKRRW